MTKREFYEQYRWRETDLHELSRLIYDYELSDCIELKDGEDYDNWIDGEARENLDYGSWEDARAFLNSIEDWGEYHLFLNEYYDREVDESDIEYVLDQLEGVLSDWCDEWYDDDPDGSVEEEDETFNGNTDNDVSMLLTF